MPNELEISRRKLLLAKARADLYEAENCLKASEEEAAKAAALVVGQYPGQTPSDPSIYLHSIKRILTGLPLEVVTKFADPALGIARSSEFLPTLAVIHKWIDHELYLFERKAQNARDTIFTLDHGDSDVSRETPEERAAHVDAKLAEIGMTKKDQRIANLEESLKPSGKNFGQRDVGWDARNEAMKNLEATTRQAEGDDADTFIPVGSAIKP